MAYNSNIAPHVSSSSFGQVIVDTISDVKSSIAKGIAYRQTYRALAALTDRELADVGVERNMIHDVAQRSADSI